MSTCNTQCEIKVNKPSKRGNGGRRDSGTTDSIKKSRESSHLGQVESIRSAALNITTKEKKITDLCLQAER